MEYLITYGDIDDQNFVRVWCENKDSLAECIYDLDDYVISIMRV